MIHFTSDKGIKSPEEENLELKDTIKKLEIQLKTTNEVQDFLEELIVELAQKVY